ncbi:acyl-CoA carboxylase subunit epsilon [Demetria terragena]|uniref:acyl-CoA carboxylase subunit epsilon n=1 Tax=Demetria terragena TaxID=63959 RepID=UPI0003A83C1F|nr:acyl-CoA carboxylase subunit epsilon [Demetria terragena]
MSTPLIIRGAATPQDIAAVVAVLSTLGGTNPEGAAPVQVWGHAARQVGAGIRPGPGAWARSALPR